MLHIMNLNPEPFILIKSGQKDIEMRLYDEKRRKIRRGDMIKFVNTESGDEITVKVKDLHICKNFGELYDKFDKIRLGYREDEIAFPEDMEQYYSPENIKRFGVAGIEIEL